MTGSHYSQHNIDIFVELHNKASTGAKQIEQDMKKAEDSVDGLTRSQKHNSSQSQSWSTRAGNAVQKVGQGFVDGGHKMQDFGKKYRGMSVATITAGAKLAETQSKYTRTITATALANDEYQDGTKTLGQVTEETKASIDKLSESFKTITKQEMAGQFLEISRAGFTGNDAINVMEASMRLSTATGEDLGNMTEILIRSMGAFGLSSESAGEAAATLASAANASTMDVGDMTQALNMVGAVAHDSGLTLKETSDAIGYMHDKGIQASTGARSLRTVLAGLNETGSDQNAIMQELGMEVDELGRVKYSSLADFVQKYQDATKDMSDEEKANAAIKIAGKEAYAGFLALTSEAGEAVDEYGNKIEGSTKTLEDFAEETSKFTEEDLKNMQKEIEDSDPWLVMKTEIADTALALAQELAPMILEVMKKLTEFLQKLQDPEYMAFIAKVVEMGVKFLAFSQVVRVVGKFVSGFGHIIKGVGGVMKIVGTVSSALTGGMGLLGGGFLLATAKAALIAAAIAAVVKVIVTAYKENEKFREVVDNVFKAAAEFVEVAVELMALALTALIKVFTKVIEWVKKIGEFFGKIFGKASKDVDTESKKIGESTEKNTKKAKDSAEKNAQGVGDGVDKGTKKASDAAKKNSDQVAKGVDKGTLEASRKAEQNMNKMATSVDNNSKQVVATVNKMSTDISTAAEKATSNFNKSFNNMGKGATNSMKSLSQVVRNGMLKVANDSGRGGTTASRDFNNGFRPISTNARTIAYNTRSAIYSALSGINLYNYGYNAMVSFANGMNSAMGHVYRAANHARSAASSSESFITYSPMDTDGQGVQMSALGFTSTPVATVMGGVTNVMNNLPVHKEESKSDTDVNIVIYESFDGDKITRTVNQNNAKERTRIKTIRR